MSATSKQTIQRRLAGGNVWLSHQANTASAESDYLARLPVRDLVYEVLPSEAALGRAMFDEIVTAAVAKDGPLVMILVGGRGGQALHRRLGALAKTNEHDALLGKEFFRKVKSFTSRYNSIRTPDFGCEFIRMSAR
jgi:hypothetical protein